MKDSVVLILGFCIFETFGNIAYKAKFIGHVKVAGDGQLVYALSVTHCLAQCNKDANCDAINFFDELNKCRLFKKCTPTRVLMLSDHHYFFSKRPPISKDGYVYEERSDSCLKLTDMEGEYKEAEKHCEHDKAYLSSLNTPELIAMASELLSFKNQTEAWASPLSDADKHSLMSSRTKKGISYTFHVTSHLQYWVKPLKIMPVQTIVNKVPGKPIPLLKSHPSMRQFKLPKDGLEDNTNDLQQWFKRKPSVWPTDVTCLHSNDKDPLEEVIQILTTNDPQADSNLVEFRFKDKSFTPITPTTQYINLLEIEGSCIHVEAIQGEHQFPTGFHHTSLDTKVEVEENDSINDNSKAGADDDESNDEIEDDESRETKYEKDDSFQFPRVSKTKKLMNQFNFCERATITHQNTLKDTSTETTPAMRATFSEYVTQWIIYDSYQEDSKTQEQEKEKNKKEKSATGVKKLDFHRKSMNEKKDVINSNIVKKALILERMINQNMFNDILHDFRYFEDPSDEYRNNEGTLLPLWKFQYNTTKKLGITGIKWNPRYYDLFALSFGSFDFQNQPSNGCFSLWSLKNPSIPEFISYTQSGVTTLDFHPNKPYLIVVGMNNGTVAVYDCRLPNKPPTYESSHVQNKHEGTVWQVLWGEDLTEGEPTFFSISSDGNVFNWTLMQNQLIRTLVISLVNPQNSTIEEEEKNLLTDSGTCIALHPVDKSIFLVGTEEGYIYKCSTAYLSMYLFIYEAHNMPVYCIDYNKYSSNIFASCSADWTIKVWEDERKQPLFILDTNNSVEDVKWAPYSSTVIAAVSLDCITYVFDLNVNKYRPICTQKISSRKTCQMHKIAFNWKLPIIVVGDDQGVASILKLSPNLRLKHKLAKKAHGVDPEELEIQKLNKLLSLIREPPSEAKKFNVTSNMDSKNSRGEMD